MEIYETVLGRESGSKISDGGGRWCQVLEVLLGALGLIEEIKRTCASRGLRRDRITKFNLHNYTLEPH